MEKRPDKIGVWNGDLGKLIRHFHIKGPYQLGVQSQRENKNGIR